MPGQMGVQTPVLPLELNDLCVAVAEVQAVPDATLYGVVKA
jgi:hypothetical protein